MTEPTQAQIEEAEKLKHLYLPNIGSSVVPWLPALIAHIRREARNAALEEAVEMCKVFAKEWRQIAEGANHWMCDAKADAAEDIAEELRALKDQP